MGFNSRFKGLRCHFETFLDVLAHIIQLSIQLRTSSLLACGAFCGNVSAPFFFRSPKVNIRNFQLYVIPNQFLHSWSQCIWKVTSFHNRCEGINGGGFGNVTWQIFTALLTFAKTSHLRIQNLCLYGPTHLVTEEADDGIRPQVSEVGTLFLKKNGGHC